RIGENAVLAPSFDDVVTGGENVSFIGYGCPGKSGRPETYAGQLVPLAGGPTISLPVAWLSKVGRPRQECGWLAGSVQAALAPGLWTFKPPPNLAGEAESDGVEFNVAPAVVSEGAAPAEARP